MAVKQASLFSAPSVATDLAPIEPLRADRSRPLTAAQRRFNTLLKQIDALRTDLEQWQQFMDGHLGRVSSELLPAATVLLARDLSYNESLALAKAQEEEELYREMQSDVVMQVLRRLSAVRV